jgi:hypothetical protein
VYLRPRGDVAIFPCTLGLLFRFDFYLPKKSGCEYVERDLHLGGSVLDSQSASLQEPIRPAVRKRAFLIALPVNECNGDSSPTRINVRKGEPPG